MQKVIMLTNIKRHYENKSTIQIDVIQKMSWLLNRAKVNCKPSTTKVLGRWYICVEVFISHQGYEKKYEW